MAISVKISVLVLALATTLPLIESAVYGPYALSTLSRPNKYISEVFSVAQIVDVPDFLLRIHRPGLTGQSGTVSFEAVKFPNHFLTEVGLVGNLHFLRAPDHRQATFYEHINKWKPGTTAFESVAYPGKYIQIEIHGFIIKFITVRNLKPPPEKARASWKLNYKGQKCRLPSVNSAVFTPFRNTYENGAEVRLSCPGTHLARGSTTKITCSEGSFRPYHIDFSCIKKECTRPSVSGAVFSPFHHIYQDGVEVSLSCPDTHSASGSTTKITCSGGSFRPAHIDFSCIKKCDKPSVPAGATFSPDLDKYSSGQTLKLSCDSSLYTSSGTSDYVCTEGNFPTIDFNCISKCDKPSVPAGATFEPDLDKYSSGQTLKLSCDSSSYTSSGTSDYVCTEGSFPTIDFNCLPKCDKPSVPAGATFSPDLDKYSSGQTLKLSCDSSSYTSSGTSDYVCTEGSFPTIDFECIETLCTLPDIVDVEFSPSQDTYKNGDVVRLSCPDTHSSSGKTKKITCSGGSFSPADIDFSCTELTNKGKAEKACRLHPYKSYGYLARSRKELDYNLAAKFCADADATLPHRAMKTLADRQAVSAVANVETTYFWLGMKKVGGSYQWDDGSSVDVAQFATNGEMLDDGDCVVSWKGDGSAYDLLNGVKCDYQLREMMRNLKKNHGFERAKQKILCEFECL